MSCPMCGSERIDVLHVEHEDDVGRVESADLFECFGCGARGEIE